VVKIVWNSFSGADGRDSEKAIVITRRRTGRKTIDRLFKEERPNQNSMATPIQTARLIVARICTTRQLPVRGFKSLLLPKTLAWAVDYGSILRHYFLLRLCPPHWRIAKTSNTTKRRRSVLLTGTNPLIEPGSNGKVMTFRKYNKFAKAM